jgi:hypothetical protein
MGRTLPRSDEVRAKERRLTDFVFHEVESKPAPGKAQGAVPAGRKEKGHRENVRNATNCETGSACPVPRDAESR